MTPYEVHLLEKILEEVKGLREDLQNAPETIQNHPIPKLADALPMPVNKPNRCQRCGIGLESLTGYVCSDPACPTGLGPITS